MDWLKKLAPQPGKVAKGALIAAAGAALTYLTAWVGNTDFGAWTPAVVAAWSAVVNAIRHALTSDPKEPQ